MEQLTFGGFYDQNDDNDLHYTRNYGITMQFHQKKQLDEIRYQIKTTCLKQADNWMWEVTLDKTALYINDKHPDSFKQRLDTDFGTKVLYPISVWVTPFGVIKDITDTSFQSITDRYKNFKKRTLQENSGTSIEYYLLNLEKGIATQKKLLMHLSFDWFWSLYFAPIYDDTVKQLMLPLQANTPKVSYTGTIKEKATLSYYNTQQRVFNGQVSSSHFKKYPATQYYTAGINLCYDFDPNDGRIKNITSDQSILENQDIIQRIQISIDHLPEKDVSQSNLNYTNKTIETKKLTLKDKVLKWWNI